MSLMLESSSTKTFCVCLSPAQNMKSYSAASTIWYAGTSNRRLGPSTPAHSADIAMPSAGDENMPSWSTSTGVG